MGGRSVNVSSEKKGFGARLHWRNARGQRRGSGGSSEGCCIDRNVKEDEQDWGTQRGLSGKSASRMLICGDWMVMMAAQNVIDGGGDG